MADDLPPPTPSPSQGDLGPLALRAYDLLRERGQPIEEVVLVSHCFGVRLRPAAQTTTFWVGRLHRLLENETIFRRCGATLWGLTDWERAVDPLDMLEYVVLDVETTGLSPDRDRITEVAAIHMRGATIVATFTSLINPQRAIPAMITGMTGISNTLVADAPLMADVLPDLLAFIGRKPLVGHNVRFDSNFLTAEAERCGGSVRMSYLLDTIRLAVVLMPGLGRPSLDRLCHRLAITVPDAGRHRALTDARLTALAFQGLLVRARAQGIHSVDGLIAAAAPPRTRGASPTPPRQGQAVIRQMRRDLPTKPGVYLMKDSQGTIIYVGKAKSLRDRVSSYSHNTAYERKTDALLETVASLEIIVVGSELEALLLESRLIKEYQPRFNVQQRYFAHYPFIKVDVGSPYPRVALCQQIGDDDSRYFGPYHNTSAARHLIEIVQRLFPIRTCTRKLLPPTPVTPAQHGARRRPAPAPRSVPCLRYQLGRCLGPCHSGVSPSVYHRMIGEVLDFLAGSRDELLDRLVAERTRAADRLDFERAAQLHHMLEQTRRMLIRQNILSGAVERHNVLILAPSVDDDAVEVFGICHSRLLGQVRVPRQVGSSTTEDAHPALLTLLQRMAVAPAPPLTIGKHEVDSIAIIARWINSRPGDPTFIPVPRSPALPLVETVRNVLAAIHEVPVAAVVPEDIAMPLITARDI